MSWIQDLYRTYDACAGAVGASSGGYEMLMPVGHTSFMTTIEIWLRPEGTFVNALRDKGKGISICAPCTSDSEGRTAKVSPHPLFDQLQYIAGDYQVFTGHSNSEHYNAYIASLKSWCDSEYAHPKVLAIYSYVMRGTVLQDLLRSRVFTLDELRKTKVEDGKEKPLIAKVGVRFRVAVEGDLEDRVWLDKDIQDIHVKRLAHAEGKPGFCYALGQVRALTVNHPKKINSRAANAKLISSNAQRNDQRDFVYRGRFTSAEQAVAVSFEASQKAHQVLRWLIQTRGYTCGTQAIVAWAVDKVSSVPSFYESSSDIYEIEAVSDSDLIIQAQNQTFVDYARELHGALLSSGRVSRLKAHRRQVVVIATEVPIEGRMSITYYRRLTEGEYLERVVHWHDTCKWFQTFGKDKKDTGKLGYFVGAPSFDRIIEAVLGGKRSHTDDSYDKQKKAARERLLHCVFDGERIPRDMVTNAINRASKPLTLEKTKAKSPAERWEEWEQVLCTACAMVRRYYEDYEGEEFDVALESQRTDRDYLYGRLLAVADRIESAARHKQGGAKDERATNAMRYMTAFAQHPFRTWNMLFTQQLNPYIQQLNGAGWHLDQVEKIMALFKDGDYESDSPLSGKYLLGFFAQRQEMRTGSTEQNKGVNGGELNESK